MNNKTGIVETIPVDFYNKNERLQQALSACPTLGGMAWRFFRNEPKVRSRNDIKEGSVETNPALFFRQSHEKTI
jgi:hypothetical protein